jgi:hypothetical protein
VGNYITSPSVPEKSLTFPNPTKSSYKLVVFNFQIVERGSKMKRNREEEEFDYVILLEIPEETAHATWRITSWEIWKTFGLPLEASIDDKYFRAKANVWDWEATEKNNYDHVKGDQWKEIGEREALVFQMRNRCVVLCHTWEELPPTDYVEAYKKHKENGSAESL